ncbi:MAG: hypothetical protein JSV92_02595 [archaeon]|nr:MAG: hypothetical protein JSV92_02595 [archaeon]
MIIIIAVGIMGAALGIILMEPEVDAVFDIRHVEKTGNGFIMSIGEESVIEWKINPEIEGVRLELPKGLEHLEGELEYKNGNDGVSVRAVKVGKWQLAVSTQRGEYSPSLEYFVCIGTTDEDARKYCD